jgi:phage tail tube protein FII
MKNFQSKGDDKLLTIIDYEGNPVDMEGYIVNISLPEIQLETSDTKFFGKKGKTTRDQGYSPAEFSGELESYNREISMVFLEAEKSKRPLTVQLTMEFNEIETGEMQEHTYTMKGKVVKSPMLGQLNGSDYAKFGFMMKIGYYKINDGTSPTPVWTVENGWEFE